MYPGPLAYTHWSYLLKTSFIPHIDSFFIEVRSPRKGIGKAVFNSHIKPTVVKRLNEVFSMDVEAELILCASIHIEVKTLEACQA